MSNPGQITDPNGETAQILQQSPDHSRLLVRLRDGRQVWIDRNVLNSESGVLRVAKPFSTMKVSESQEPRATTQPAQRPAPTGEIHSEERLVVPVIEERLHVERQAVETGTIRIDKRVHEREEIVEQPVLREDVHIERVPVNRVVEGTPSIRYEGETMIVPLLEEVIVVEKRMMLREEVRVTRRRETVQGRQPVTLRSEEVVIDRTNPQR